MNIIPIGTGKCSNFGGEADTGVAPDEGLALIQQTDLSSWWFRRLFVSAAQWDNSKGLARNLNPNAFYCAMRWAYGSFAGVQGEILQGVEVGVIKHACLIIVEVQGAAPIFCQPADFGPNLDTGRLIDLSPGACKALGVSTDDEVTVSAIFG